ncbi:MAG TPA: HD domain-containing protein [Gemmataceae bacterium]|nr:HD domain-containing protein [Gemmataceae bacterium]
MDAAAYPDLLRAVAFAARAHRHQLRKDGETPYVSHVFRVCLTVRQLFGIDEVPALLAAVLHDTIEDTNTDYDDIAEAFGAQVADWVAALTKNKGLPEEEREKDYCRRLAAAPWQVKACKLADVYDNLQDSRTGSKSPLKTIPRSRMYLEVLDVPDLPPVARRAWEVVQRLLEEREKEVPAAK